MAFYRVERDRGINESLQQRARLREKWPHAFPLKQQDIRPLTIGATGEIAAAMGWSVPYTLGVLFHWKLAPAYCKAVLCHNQRITLDGAPAEAVDDEAKDLASKRLAQLAARKAAKKASSAAPAMAKAKPSEALPTKALPETPVPPAQLHAHVRAALLRRSA
jgi:sRNA-binding protein